MSDHNAYKKLAYFTMKDLQKLMEDDKYQFKHENINKIVSYFGEHY